VSIETIAPAGISADSYPGDAELLGTAATMMAALDRLCHGMVLVEADGCIRYANRIARRLGAEGDGLRIRDGHLAGVAMPDALQLSEALKCVAAGGRDVGLRLRRPSGRRPLFVRVTAVASPGPEPHSMGALVLITDPDAVLLPSQEQLTDIYALTVAESALTHILLQGRELGEAARALNVRVTTARKHLRSIFVKTGTRRQAELVRVLLQEVGRIA
jgi:DNA-binding CsgD family transcriptional regulator